MTKNARALRSLFRRRYIIGLLLLAGLACASLYVNYNQTSRQTGRAELINLASSQKSLSQRISFFANALATTSAPSDRATLKAELSETIKQMRRAHNILSGQTEISQKARKKLKTVHDIYFNEYAPFDEEVKAFLLSAEAVLAANETDQYENAADLTAINLLGIHTIMQTHDVITRIIAYETEEEIAQAKLIQTIFTALILLFLLLESIWIFEPMGQRIEESIRQAEQSEEIAQAAANRAQIASEAKSNFLRVMSHEMRTPLNAVIGMSELLKGSSLDLKQRGYVGHIWSAGQHMLSLANDILTINQDAAGKLKIELGSGDLTKEINNVVGMLQPKALESCLTLSAQIDEKLDGLFEIDAQRLRQVMINLIGNAIKFTERGGIKVIAQHAYDDAAQNTIGVEIRVIDTGVGIAPEKQQIIFEEFEQAHDFHERSYGGAGLGLSISKKIISAMNGDLSLEKSSPQGSTFFIKLALKRAERIGAPQFCAPTPKSAPKEQAPVKKTSQRKILVVDDNAANRLIASAFLKKAGYEVELAENGQEAVDTCTRDSAIAMTFMDVEMPVMDGITATRAIRDKGLDEIRMPIIALTAHVLAEDNDKLLEAGFVEVLRKPVSEQSIVACARKFTQRAAAA